MHGNPSAAGNGPTVRLPDRVPGTRAATQGTARRRRDASLRAHLHGVPVAVPAPPVSDIVGRFPARRPRDGVDRPARLDDPRADATRRGTGADDRGRSIHGRHRGSRGSGLGGIRAVQPGPPGPRRHLRAPGGGDREPVRCGRRHVRAQRAPARRRDRRRRDREPGARPHGGLAGLGRRRRRRVRDARGLLPRFLPTARARRAKDPRSRSRRGGVRPRMDDPAGDRELVRRSPGRAVVGLVRDDRDRVRRVAVPADRRRGSSWRVRSCRRSFARGALLSRTEREPPRHPARSRRGRSSGGRDPRAGRAA